MKDNDSVSEEEYFKDVKIGALILGWIPFSIVIFLITFSVWTITAMILRTLLYADFSIRWYLFNESAFADPALPSLVASAFCLYSMQQGYRLIKKESYASINFEKLILKFGKNSFLWDDIQEVYLEGNRKLIIAFLDEKMIRKKRFDLKWLQGKEDFIHNIKSYCSARKIPFHESEIGFFSLMELETKSKDLYL